jgi:hypothetical protein
MQIDVAMIEWALGDFDAAMGHLVLAIELASKPGSVVSVADAKGTFVYLYADWVVSQKPAVRDDWRTRAYAYYGELKKTSDLATQDSLGFYQIVFGSTREEVDEGRRIVKQAHDAAPAEVRPFYLYHEHIALKRLGELLNADESSGAVIGLGSRATTSSSKPSDLSGKDKPSKNSARRKSSSR